MRRIDQVVGGSSPSRGRTFAGTNFQGTGADSFDDEPCHSAVNVGFVALRCQVGKGDSRLCVFSNRPNSRGKRRQRRCVVYVDHGTRFFAVDGLGAPVAVNVTHHQANSIAHVSITQLVRTGSSRVDICPVRAIVGTALPLVDQGSQRVRVNQQIGGRHEDLILDNRASKADATCRRVISRIDDSYRQWCDVVTIVLTVRADHPKTDLSAMQSLGEMIVTRRHQDRLRRAEICWTEGEYTGTKVKAIVIVLLQVDLDILRRCGPQTQAQCLRAAAVALFQRQRAISSNTHADSATDDT